MYATRTANRYLFFTTLLYIFATFFLSFILSAFHLEPGVIPLILISQWGMVFIPIVIYFIVTKQQVFSTVLLRKIKPLNILFSVLFGFLILPTLYLIGTISQLFVENYVTDLVTDLLSYPFWLSVLLIAATPAFLEEIAMRSIIISNYRSKKVLTTCIISGFFFGMFHMNLNQFSYAFVMGALMCLVVHLTGSILSSMIIHFVVNFNSIFWPSLILWVEKFYQKNYPDLAAQLQTQMDVVPTTNDLIMAIVGLLGINLVTIPLVILVLYGLMKYNKKERILKDKLTTAEVLGIEQSFPLQQEKIFTPTLIAAIACFSLYVILNEIIAPLL